jgi:hypothetical protein
MESSVWGKILEFAKSCFTHYYRTIFVGGFIGGGLSGISLFFIGVNSELVTFGAFFLKVLGTAILGIASGAGAVLGKKLIENKNSTDVTPQRRRKRKGDKAA